MGTKGFLEYPFAPWVRENAERTFTNTLAEIQACTHCGKCEEVCPHHLPVMDMLERIKEDQAALLAELERMKWSDDYQGSESPFPKRVLESWISGGKKRNV